MTKSFMGVRLRRIREERGLTQLAAARALGLSASYYNQLENDERPLTVAALVKISSVFGVDVQVFSEEEERRLLAEMRDALTVTGLPDAVSLAELREVASKMPAFGQALVRLHRRMREATEAAELMASRLGDSGHAPITAAPMPFEEVRDFFYAHHNYFGELDERAEALFTEAGLKIGDTATGLAERLASRHGIRIVVESGADAETGRTLLRRFDADRRLLRLDPQLSPGQRAFQMATQLAFLEVDPVLRRLIADSGLSSEESRTLARMGLASHFAGALIMPYAAFREATEQAQYDIEVLEQRFGVGFEVICHRLSTLQRQGARGIPFFFIRVDRAGNVSKRQSATDFHFSRVGGTCPLWNVYEAFAQPGRILTQIAQMPDGRMYFWIARTVSSHQPGYGAPSKTFAIGLGCDLQHADRLVYSRGLDLRDPRGVALIGVGCKVCERPACSQRAFPPVGRLIDVREGETRFEPYRVADRRRP